MYFTIHGDHPSTSLSSDALGSHQRLRQHAVLLARLSASFTTEANAVADAYARALAGGGGESWASFLAAAATLVRHVESLDSLLHLNSRERAAYEFFAQIVRENDDLLVAGAVSA